MTLLPSAREQLLETILAWASAAPAVRALVLVGSSARADPPADAWSDLDLVLAAEPPELFLETAGWLAAFGEPWIATLERDPAGRIVERRVLYRTGVDADFILLSPANLSAFQVEPLRAIAARGVSILLDKDGALPAFLPPPPAPSPLPLPSPAEFSELVADFWFHAAWTAKKLRRGELWTAKSCCDVYMKRLLLTLLEWRARLLGDQQDTFYNGRFIERWAPDWVLERLRTAFARYDEQDIWLALASTTRLFDQLAAETALRLGYPYPQARARSISAWVDELAGGGEG